MSDNRPTVEDAKASTDPNAYVRVSAGDMLVMLTRLTVITSNVITAVSLMARGDPTNAGRIASEAAVKLDVVLEEIGEKLREALDEHGG